MAEGGTPNSEIELNENIKEQDDEMLVLESIYGQKCMQILKTGRGENSHCHNRYVFQISLKAKSDSARHRVEVFYLLVDDGVLAESFTCDVETSNKTISSQRTVSGTRSNGTFEVKHLSPLVLQISLPPSYPSASPPDFTLSCLWLSADQLSNLCHQLDKLWLDSEGMPIIFTWADWLENNTFSFLGLEEDLTLTVPTVPAAQAVDSRVVVDHDDLNRITTELKRYDLQHRSKVQECGVCFDEKPGSSLYVIPDCSHHICQKCMTPYCQKIVQEGTVTELRCPGSKCDAKIPCCILEKVLRSEDFERWERLKLLQDPRFLSYIEKLEKCNNSPQGVLRKEKEKLFLERKRLIEEFNTRQLIRVKTKKCPKCKSNIQKNGRCKWVQCTQCNSAMCWSCGQDITKFVYRHFSTSPKCKEIIYDEQDLLIPEAVVKINATLEVYPDAAKNKIKCPTCKQLSLKDIDGNNHIKCWNCKQNFCFMCKQCIVGTVTSHYGHANLCKQHS